MKSKDYLQDIQDIKMMMAKSSQFISLSGLSGILAGIYALIGAYAAYKTVYFNTSETRLYKNLTISQEGAIKLLLIAGLVAFLSIVTGYYFSVQKSKKQNVSIWNATTRRLLINFLIPLFTGAYIVLYLIEKEMIGLVAPLTLIFYGLACINASQFTVGDVQYLGRTILILGIISTWFLGYGLLFWALGFGICHIIYGTMMYYKYDRK